LNPFLDDPRDEREGGDLKGIEMRKGNILSHIFLLKL
jgi:hypothetical protein